jgi:CDP-paratose 2-epimerase
MTFADRRLLITGGAGFIGSNLAHRALCAGARVVVLDDLSRAGVEDNLVRLRALHPTVRLRIEHGDVRDATTVRRALTGVDAVYHFAAQVAVTTSLVDPVGDFSVNLQGTLNVLEELRRLPDPPPLLFTSTNKVYGDLSDVATRRVRQRYVPTNRRILQDGIGEDRPLSFCSPYGCSKGSADQYVLDYAKSYGLRAVVFRMSCIYGPHQCGTEDQGWVAHFLVQAMTGRPIAIFGDGMQVRDALYVDDLIDAMELVLERIERVRGSAFNIGGGVSNTTSLLELLEHTSRLSGSPPEVRYGGWRIGDQRWFVSDTRRFMAATGWRPKIDVRTGVERLYDWLREHRVVESMEAAS